jgi:cobalt-zinc-cadmium efflux system membrane fusion protein
MHAALTVFEKDLALVKPNQKVWVTFVDEPEREYECEVLLVSRNVDQDRGALVHCHFEQQPDRLLPGMFLNARIQISSSQQWAVPAESLVRFENQDYLVEAKDSLHFSLLPVVKLMEEDGWIAVKAEQVELQGKRFVVRNPYPVLGAMKAGEEEGHDH